MCAQYSGESVFYSSLSITFSPLAGLRDEAGEGTAGDVRRRWRTRSADSGKAANLVLLHFTGMWNSNRASTIFTYDRFRGSAFHWHCEQWNSHHASTFQLICENLNDINLNVDLSIACLQEIKEAVELPLTHPEYYEEMGIKPPKGTPPDIDWLALHLKTRYSNDLSFSRHPMMVVPRGVRIDWVWSWK